MINYIINFSVGFFVFYLLNFTLYEYLTIELNNDKGSTRID
mgnify:CR=1 FL=1